MSGRSALTVFALSILAFAVATAAKAPPGPMGWAYPHPAVRKLPTMYVSKPVHSVPGSPRRYTEAQLDNPFEAVDWFPGGHPAMPAVVAHGHQPDVMACAMCHLPNGQGRYAIPNLAGLPKSYIVEQLTAFRTGGRKASLPIRSVEDMADLARHLSPADAAQAATYFSRLTYKPWFVVRETANVPNFGPTYWGAYQPLPGHSLRPLGQRIIELPIDEQRAEEGDPHAGYIAYVPPGSLALGKAIITRGFAGGPVCTSCHGPSLKGSGVAPPLAGRSPTYIVRQLWDMHTGHRNGGNAAMMQPVAARLTPQAIVAVAGYAASLKP